MSPGRSTPRFNELPEHEQRALETAATKLSKPPPAGDERRRSRRHPYVVKGVRLLITEPNFNRSELHVTTQDLSAHGVACFHRRFLYPDTRCAIELYRLDNELVLVEGRVVDSRYRAEGLHLIAIEFHRPVTVTAFVAIDDDGDDD